MCVSDPGECAEHGDEDGQVRDDAHDENRVVVDLVVPENVCAGRISM